MADNHKLLAIYAYIDDVCSALRMLKAEEVSVETVYSPAPNEELNQALEMKPSPVRGFVLFGGLFGLFSGFALATYTAVQWKLIVWGKPPVPIVPYVVVSFEFCVLMSVLFGLLGLLILSRMPRYRTPAHFDARFTVDRFGILLTCPAGLRDKIVGLLREKGAEEVRDV